MVQGVADAGRLVAHHANLRVRTGVGASIKESVAIPVGWDAICRGADPSRPAAFSPSG